MKNLDFIIVGAQKCATTTLHKYLQEHAAVALPADKEAPFFNGSEFDESRYESFLQENYLQQDTEGKKLWGKASPQYMSSPLIPARVKSANPNAKIIAVLRNPLKRAFSHYRMAVRRGTESRTFEQAISAAIEDSALKTGRSNFAPTHKQGYESESDFYAVWGEYGRILQNYRNEFGADNLMVIFTDDLQANPGQCLDKICEFIGLESGWRPESLGREFHKGGGRPWINPRAFKQIVNAPLFATIYGRISESHKRKIRYWVDQLNVRKTEASFELSTEVRNQLNRHYREDAEILTQLGYTPPWLAEIRGVDDGKKRFEAFSQIATA